MKKFYSLLMISMALFAVACGDDDEKGGDTPTLFADNSLVYDGVTYKGQCRVTTSNNVIQYVLAGEGFQLSGNIGSTANTNTTIDLTKHYEDMMFAAHINIENQDSFLDLQYQNYPQNYWCFLDGNNLGASSCFKSGTATVIVNDGNLTLVVDGTLINDKRLRYKIVYNQANVPESKATKNEIVVDGHSYTVEASVRYSSNADLSYEYLLVGQENNAPIVKVEIAPASLGKTILLTEKKAASRYRVTIYFNDGEEITASQDAFFEDVTSSYWDVAKQESTPVQGCLFTSGTLSTSKDDSTISMIFNGTLTNGRSVSSQALVDISKIEVKNI